MFAKVAEQLWHSISSWRVGDHCVSSRLVVGVDRCVAEVGHDKGSCSMGDRSMRSGDHRRDLCTLLIARICQEGRSRAS